MDQQTLSKSPIFIGGVERSGTSLLYALLASHPQLAMTRRTNLWMYFYRRYGDLREERNLQRCLDAMQRYKRLAVVSPDYVSIREAFRPGEDDYGQLFALIEEQYAQRLGKIRWGDKSLNSERFAPAIFAAYPEARFIHIIRDPRDRYASALKRWKVIRGGVGSGTTMWLNSIWIGKRNLRRYAGKYMFLRYETLAAEPEKTLRAVCSFIGEPYSPEMLSMRGAEIFRDEGGNSSFEARPPGEISTSSVGRYQKYLSQRQIAFIQGLAGREMQEFQYPLAPITLSGRDKAAFWGVDYPINLVRGSAWLLQEAVLDRVGRAVPAHRILPAAAGLQVGG